jgi:phenylalanyl-tRNA synthetase alpha chain
VDLSLPGASAWRGGRHPVTQVIDEIWAIFRSMGFTRARGPEAETEWYNFVALNTPLDHPAADEQDTLYLKGGLLIRSHTSPVQIRTMENYKPPIRILAPGMVYRRDTWDATHAPAFAQLEGLVVDEGITFVDFKATLAEFARRLLGGGDPGALPAPPSSPSRSPRPRWM